MKRVILDTNILVSMALGGQVGKINDRWRAGEFIVVVAELVRIQTMISLWQRAWDEASQNPKQRLLLSVQAKDWSDKAVDFSGLV